MIVSLWMLACASEPVVAPAPPPVPPPSTIPADMPRVETLLGDAPGIHFVGDWTSTGCEGRSYARNIRFESENTWAAIDLVSPCPTGTTCSWSGLVTFSGIWKIQGQELLTREVGGTTQTGGPHPTKFVATKDGKLVENGCTYETGLTVPEGYEKDRVTPKIPR